MLHAAMVGGRLESEEGFSKIPAGHFRAKGTFLPSETSPLGLGQQRLPRETDY